MAKQTPISDQAAELALRMAASLAQLDLAPGPVPCRGVPKPNPRAILRAPIRRPAAIRRLAPTPN